VLAARRTSPALCTLIGSTTLLRRSKSNLTNVELLWLEKRIENWIRFGPSAEEQILDKRRRGVSFARGSVIAFLRWILNDFGPVISRIDIIRAVAPRQRCATVPHVRPGGDIPLRLSGWSKVERVLNPAHSPESPIPQIRRAGRYEKAIQRTVVALADWLRLQKQRGLIALDDAGEAAGMLLGMLTSAPRRAAMFGGLPLPSRLEMEARVRRCSCGDAR